MKMKMLQKLGILIVMLFTTQLAQAEEGKALMTADYVRVREKPNKDAPQVGFLYKNMAVEIKSKTPEVEKIGDDSFYWYEVKNSELSGWVYGKFLTTDAANWDVDTYDAPGDMQTLSTRFGESTWYYTQSMNLQSFSIDDYRNLMRAAEDGDEQAWVALRATILKHLYENPDDATFAYLKKRLYSAEYLMAILNQPYAQDSEGFFDIFPNAKEFVIRLMKEKPEFADSIPDEYWNDKEFVRQLIKGPGGCDYANRISRSFENDAQIMGALIMCPPSPSPSPSR